jgi:hypothetical protein
MGRASNRKWAKRRSAYARAKVAARAALRLLFGHHPRFRRKRRTA